VTGPWRVVDLIHYEGEVHASKAHLRLGGEHSVPLVDVVVILTGTQCRLHASTLDQAAASGVPLVHCDWRGVPTSATYSWSNHTRVGARHRAQAELSLPRQKNAWMRLVQAKIRGQAAVLQKLQRPGAEELTSLSRRVRSGDPANLEGQASRLYWPRLLGDRTFRRQPGSREGANGMLDYGYAVLRGACLRAVVSAGLAPALGLWHRRRDNPFALVDDIIEPFRPAVDLIVAESWLPGGDLGRSKKARLAAVLDVPMDRTGVTVDTAVGRLAQQLGGYVEGSVSRLAPPTYEALDAAG
jgi:CRISPR-associated protein Cas1